MKLERENNQKFNWQKTSFVFFLRFSPTPFNQQKSEWDRLKLTEQNFIGIFAWNWFKTRMDTGDNHLCYV